MNHTKNRKGIESVVGGLFFLILMIGGFTAIIAAFAIETNLFNMQNQLSNLVLGKIQEQFVVSAQVNQNNKNQLSIAVTNTGTTPVQIADFWVINKTASSAPATLFTVNYTSAFVASGQTSKIIDSGTPLYMTPGKYTIKVVSKRGTEQLVSFNVPYYPLVSKVIVTPNAQYVNQNATITVFVVNLGNSTIDKLNCTVGVPTNRYTAFTNTTKTIPKLPPYGSATFELEYTVTGPPGLKVDFNGTVSGIDEATGFKVKSNSTDDQMLLKPPEDLTVTDKLSITPKIYIIDPAPFGSSVTTGGSNGIGYFGVVITNPTNQSMTIDKLVVGTVANTQGSPVIVSNKSPLIQVSPTSGWAIPVTNLLTWNATFSSGGPVRISPTNSTAFVVGVQSGITTVDVPSFDVTASVFSSLGYFSNIGHTSYGKAAPTSSSIINIYPTPGNETGQTGKGLAGTGNDNAFQGTTAACPNSQVNFWLTVRSGNAGSGNVGVAGSPNNDFIIINTPIGFPIITATNNQVGGTFGSVTIRQFADTSRELLVPINKDIGFTANPNIGATCSSCDSERASFEFSATTPQLTQDHLYVLYAFMNGTDDLTNWLGPISEAVVLKIAAPSETIWENINGVPTRVTC